MTYVYPLTQFEVRYTQILNFTQLNRGTLSPYLRLAKSFNVINQGRLEESIRLNFDDDLFFIECRWDRIIFAAEIEPAKLLQANTTSLKTFWEIVKQFSESSSFGSFTHYIFLLYEINILDLPIEAILQKFKSQYLSSQIDNILESDDAAITLEKDNSKKVTTITFGPYTNKDNTKHNLFQFNSSNIESVANKNGTLLRYQVNDNFTKVDTGLISRLIDEQKKASAGFII